MTTLVITPLPGCHRVFKQSAWSIALGLMLIGPAWADKSVTPQTQRQNILNALTLPADTRISYDDGEGHCLSEKQFFEQLGKGRSFDATKHPEHHSATLSLQTAKMRAEFEAKRAHILKNVEAGQALPAFSLHTLDGRIVDNASLRGHRTLVSFFFTTCGPCIAETPVLTAFAKKHPEVPVLAITFDDENDARQFVAQRGLSWPVAYGAQAFTDQLGVQGYPAMALIGPDGKLIKAVPSDRISAPDKPLAVADLEQWLAPGKPG